jgi:hypothetical protein
MNPEQPGPPLVHKATGASEESDADDSTNQ